MCVCVCVCVDDLLKPFRGKKYNKIQQLVVLLAVSINHWGHLWQYVAGSLLLIPPRTHSKFLSPSKLVSCGLEPMERNPSMVVKLLNPERSVSAALL